MVGTLFPFSEVPRYVLPVLLLWDTFDWLLFGYSSGFGLL
jgi:hypothetical protein